MSGAFGQDGFGSSPYGSAFGGFNVTSAVSLGDTYVQIFFSGPIDPSYGALLSPSNYTFTPSLTVLAVEAFGVDSVRVRTSSQSAILYQVEVTDARSYDGRFLTPPKTAVFEGISGTITFFAVATDRRRVRLVFGAGMRDDAALIDPANYTLTDYAGASVLFSEIVREQPLLRAVDIALDGDLQPAQFYKVTVSAVVRASDGRAVSPNIALLQFVENATQAGKQPLTIPLGAFSGEVVGDPMLGTPPGLVFFSPALEQSAANSIIQVDDVAVCTKAYDEYHFPVIPDPQVLYTYGNGHAETLGQAVIWAPFPRLAEARIELGNHVAETLPPAVDSRCIATFTELWDITYVSLTNNMSWKTFDNGPVPPAYFITANNLGPIPPGPTVVRILQP